MCLNYLIEFKSTAHLVKVFFKKVYICIVLCFQCLFAGEEDASEVVWMLLYSGEKKKCSCGNWFQLHDVEGAIDH